MGTVGRVDHARNGFGPHRILEDFDAGTVSRDRQGRVVDQQVDGVADHVDHDAVTVLDEGDRPGVGVLIRTD